MVNKVKQKRRLKKVLKRGKKAQEKKIVEQAWRNIFVKAGILKD